VEAVEQVLFHIFNRSLLFNNPFGLPHSKALHGFFESVGCEDEFSLFKAVRPIHPFDLHDYIVHFVRDTALAFDEWVYINGLKQSFITICDCELELFTQKTSAFEIGQEVFPGGFIFNIRELKGEDLFELPLFTRSLTVDCESAGHHIFLDADLRTFWLMPSKDDSFVKSQTSLT